MTGLGATTYDLEIPTITSARLRLRAHTETDLNHCARMWADARVVHLIGNRPLSQEDTWSRMLKYLGHWHLKRFGFWIIEERTTGTFVGEVGFADHKRDISPSLDGIPEIGWALTPEKQGLGYATEALGIALTWADEHLATPQTAAIIHRHNISSIRIAEKTGYINGGTTFYKDQPTTIFRRDKRDKAVSI